ncbi:MAG: hypothetical protein ACI4UM_07640 [Succinivibrio sp.]
MSSIKSLFILICLLFLSSYSYAKPTYQEIVDRSYTTTTFTYPMLCKEPEFAKTCSYFTNYFAGRFEHDYIGFITDRINLESLYNDDYAQREIAIQKVDLDFRVISEFGFFSVIAKISQSYKEMNSANTEIFNIDLNSKNIIHFEDLFEDPQKASMICANAIYDSFKSFDYPKLSLIKASVEVAPKNFILLPDGIEFVFVRGELAPASHNSKVVIYLEELESAKPVKKWFPAYFEDYKEKIARTRGIDPLD